MKIKKNLVTLSTTALLLACILPASVFAKPADNNSGNVQDSKSVKILKDHGLTNTVISQLGDDARSLVNEITAKSLTQTQIDNYVKGIFKAQEQSRTVIANLKAGIVDESVQINREVKDGLVTLSNGHQIPVPQRDKDTKGQVSTLSTLASGPYYNVDAYVGYNQITELVDVPQVKSTTPSGIIPYVLGGAYVTTNKSTYSGGADVGMFYEGGVWKLAINGSNSYPVGDPLKKYYWTNSQATISSPTVYLNYKIAANNQLQITVSDSNYVYITSISYYFPDINLNQNGSNVEMSTGFSMALRNSVRRLESLGYNVTISEVS